EPFQAFDDVRGIEPDYLQDHPDQDRQQDQPEDDRQRRATEEPIEGIFGHWPLPRHAHDNILSPLFAAAVAPRPVSIFSSIRSSVSSRSASPGGLSQRSRLMRGKRMAKPDLCRVERCKPSKATSITRP